MTISQRQIVVKLILLAALTFGAYSFCLQGTFKTMDDEVSIINNDLVRDLNNLSGIMRSSFFDAKSYYRPLVTLSFALDYKWARLNALPYYLVNIFIHIASAFLVFALMNILLKRTTAAYLVALLFAIHPLQWEPVSNIPGRAILLCSFFCLSAILCFLLAEKNKMWFLLSWAGFVLALLSKESATMVPFVLLGYLVIVRYPNERLSAAGLRRCLPLLPYFVFVAGYVFIRRSLGITQLFFWPSSREAVLGVITFLRGLETYLRLFFIPTDLQFDRAQALFVTFRDPQLILTLGFYLGLGLIFYGSRRNFSRLTAFFFWWFAFELLPVSQFLATIGVQTGYISLAEHFLYMPSVAAFALLVTAAGEAYRFILNKKWLSATMLNILVVVILGAYWILTVQQNIYSSNEAAMLERTLKFNPQNVRVRYNLAYVYARNNRFDQAEKEFRKILEVEPEAINARIALGKTLVDQGKYWEGIREYEWIKEPGRLEQLLKDNLKVTYEQVIGDYRRKIQENPADGQNYYGLGVALIKTNDVEGAVTQFRKAVELNPKDENALFNLASILAVQGKMVEARDYLDRLLKLIGPDNVLYDAAYNQWNAIEAANFQKEKAKMVGEKLDVNK